MNQKRIDRLRNLGSQHRPKFQMQPTVAGKRAGYMAVADFQGERDGEDTYTIEAVEGPESHPDIPDKKLFLRFRNTDECLVLNRTNEETLREAYGARWSGRTIRLEPTVRVWDNKPVWGLQVIPLWPCQACRREHTADKATQLCPQCWQKAPRPKPAPPAKELADALLYW